MLTHAHEDHIGGMPYLLRERPDIPLVGSKLTLALIAEQARRAPDHAADRGGRGGRRAAVGPFDCEFFAVNHSIPDALAVAIRTPAGLVLHTGDFKMDQLPLDGRLTDLGGFARLGDEGVDLLMSDSTNAEVPGIVTSERDIAPVLADVFARPGSGSSWRASPATCTASSRCSIPLPRTGARSRSSAGRWCATWASPATSATCGSRRSPAASWWTSRRSTSCRPTGSS